MENEKDETEKFSDDPEEQLRVENEILKLKLRAELGGQMEELKDIPPELENMFLKNVIAFEQQHADAKRVTIFELIGSPTLEKEADMDDVDVSLALHDIVSLMEKHRLVVDYAGDYTDREKYRFLTEELFGHETMEMDIPEMITHFSYEDFHPDHKISIGERAGEFISDWFSQKVDEQTWVLADQLLAADGTIFTKLEITQKIKNVFDSYTNFENTAYKIDDVSFQLMPEGGMGHAEGMVKYDAVLETGETIHIEGPFKLYMQLEEEWWQIFFFHWPGFEW